MRLSGDAEDLIAEARKSHLMGVIEASTPMSLSSYSDVFKISHERPHDEEIVAGDMVRMGANFHPHYAVIAVDGDKAWVRNAETGTDHLADLNRCRKLASDALRFAAE